MADVHHDAIEPRAGWDRECLQAARDRNGRRLGDRAAHPALRPSSGMRSDKAPQTTSGEGEDIVILEYWKPSSGDKARRGQ
jgi:hypothetical protein